MYLAVLPNECVTAVALQLLEVNNALSIRVLSEEGVFHEGPNNTGSLHTNRAQLRAGLTFVTAEYSVDSPRKLGGCGGCHA